LLVENVQDYAIFTVDVENRITTWNHGAERLCGYSEAEVIGLSGAIIFTPEDRATGEPMKELETARAQGQALDERWHLRKDGSRFWGSGAMTALYDESGALRGFAKVLRDYTAQKQAEEALQLSQEQLRTLNAELEERIQARTAQIRELAAEVVLAEQKERERIARILHDELQQLLFAVQVHLVQIGEASAAGTQAEHSASLQETQTMIVRVIELTRQLTVDLSPPVLQGEGLVEMFRWLAMHMQRMYGLEVTVVAQAGLRLPNAERRILLFQLVRELLFNVVKHAGVKQASIELQGGHGQSIIHVRDQGRGFEVATSRARQSTSYGLRSIQERLTLFQGALKIESQPGAGTQATILMPDSA
jgi:PAS domain S-box-containing protein